MNMNNKMENKNWEKTWVSRLQEWSAKNKLALPIYEFAPRLANGFECSVHVKEHDCTGTGFATTKHDAKHLAAKSLCKQLDRKGIFGMTSLSLVVEEIENSDPEPPFVPESKDKFEQLRNYCKLNHQPLAECEVTYKKTMDGRDQYTAVCKMRDVQTTVRSETEYEAKQAAALHMLQHFKIDEDAVPSTSRARAMMKDKADAKKFTAYSEYTNAYMAKGRKGVPLCDRHNFFSNYPEHMKKAAFAIINRKYQSDREQAMDILKALHLTAKFKKAPSSGPPMVMVELDCEFDAFFVDLVETIYHTIVVYFSVMLR